MRKIKNVCLYLLLVSGTYGLLSCDKDSDAVETEPVTTKAGEQKAVANIINPILTGSVYDSLAEFFHANYQSEEEHRSFFGDDIESYESASQCFVINSREELMAHYLGEAPFPDMDFDKYTLIVGQVIMPESYYIVLRQELVSDSDGLRLNVYVPEKDSGYLMLQQLFYWGLYPKLQSSNISVNIIKEQVK